VARSFGRTVESKTLVGATLAILALVAGSSAGFSQVCETQVVSRTPYACEVKSSFGGDFHDCFQFVTPHPTVSNSFQLTVVALGDTLVCNCGAGGKFGSPKFDVSNSFFCATQEDGMNSTFVFIGTSINGGRALVKGQAFSEAGNQFVFSCKPDTTGTCAPILANVSRGQSMVVSPWDGPQR
jgi:hypothetical protein